MDIEAPQALLGGQSPAQFMRRHWQRKPLLVRQAWPGVQPPLLRSALFGLARRDDVESRLVVQQGGGWQLRRGPLPRRALPPLRQAGCTLLVQGLDLHVEAAHRMLRHFDFVPLARRDDLMLSWASDGGGVGPHLDAYDVFLLQVQGRRRWRIGRIAEPAAAAWIEDAPLKILRHFAPEQDWLLDPGDMLYLPPGWAHEGTAVGECMTCSIGFRAASRAELADDLLSRLADGDALAQAERRYRDAGQPATASPGQVPAALQAFARRAVSDALRQPGAVERALGESLSEPKAEVWFDAMTGAPATSAAVHVDARSRLLYDDSHIYFNGESFGASGRDARLLRSLADSGRLGAAERRRLSPAASALLNGWLRAGWLREEDGNEPG